MIGRRPTNLSITLRCKKCGAPLKARRSCLAVNLACPSCGAAYGLTEYGKELGEDSEEELGFIPVDRL